MDIQTEWSGNGNYKLKFGIGMENAYFVLKIPRWYGNPRQNNRWSLRQMHLAYNTFHISGIYLIRNDC